MSLASSCFGEEGEILQEEISRTVGGGGCALHRQRTGDHTFSSSVRRPPRDTAQKGPLEVRQEGGALSGGGAPALGGPRGLCRSPAAKLRGPSRWKVWGHRSLPRVVDSLGGKEKADRVKPFRGTLPGESKTPSGESVPSQNWMLEISKREKQLRRRASVSWLSSGSRG